MISFARPFAVDERKIFGMCRKIFFRGQPGVIRMAAERMQLDGDAKIIREGCGRIDSF